MPAARNPLQSAAIMGALSMALTAYDAEAIRSPQRFKKNGRQQQPKGPTSKRAKVKAARKQRHAK